MLPCTIRNKVQKLESDLKKTSFKKLPFFVHVFNSFWFQSALIPNKALLVGNSYTIRKTKHPWIRISFRNGVIAADYLFGEPKSEKMPIIVTVPTTLFSLILAFYYALQHVSAAQISYHQVGTGCTKSIQRGEDLFFSGTNYKNFIPKNE